MKTTLFGDMEMYDDFPGCCGIQVTHTFPSVREIEVEGKPTYNYTTHEYKVDPDRFATRDEIVEDMIEEFGQPRDGCNLIALIDSQLQDGWLSIVQKAGFRRIARFRNGLHGNIVNLFAHVKTEGIPAYKGRVKKMEKGGG